MIANETMMRMYRVTFLETTQGRAVLANLLSYLKFYETAGPEDADKRNTAIYILSMCGVIVHPTDDSDGTLLKIVEALSEVNGLYLLPEHKIEE